MEASHLGKWSAVVAFVLCIGGGLWILVFGGFDTDEPLGTGIGLYFVGKAFFVGATLLLLSGKNRKE